MRHQHEPLAAALLACAKAAPRRHDRFRGQPVAAAVDTAGWPGRDPWCPVPAARGRPARLLLLCLHGASSLLAPPG
jgi:hypothetical protein